MPVERSRPGHGCSGGENMRTHPSMKFWLADATASVLMKKRPRAPAGTDSRS